MDRRSSTLFLCLACVLAGCESDTPIHPGTESLLIDELRPFYHGVASGDPKSDRVIIWTRVTPENLEPTAVGWRVALDSAFENTVQAGAVTALPEQDFTVKIDVTGLKSNTQYFYRFFQDNLQSVVGRTKTTPAIGSRPVNLAIVGNSDYEDGYFNAYQSIAVRRDLDAVVQMGSYISAEAASEAALTNRRHLPGTDPVSLEDFRTRYAQYRLDPQLRAAHRNHPFIHVWDDRQVPQTQPPAAGEAAARQAYLEWSPVRERNEERMYEDYVFGSTAELLTLDQRTNGSLLPAGSATSEHQAILGGRQISWLMAKLKASQSQWKLVAFKGLFSRIEGADAVRKMTRVAGYWADDALEREQLVDSLLLYEPKNVIFLSADGGGSWACEVKDIQKTGKAKRTQSRLAVEFAAPAINSLPATEAYTDRLKNLEAGLNSNTRNADLKYVNLHESGYLLLQMEYETLSASWFYVDPMDSLSTSGTLGMKCELTQKGKLTAREPKLMTRARK